MQSPYNVRLPESSLEARTLPKRASGSPAIRPACSESLPTKVQDPQISEFDFRVPPSAPLSALDIYCVARARCASDGTAQEVVCVGGRSSSYMRPFPSSPALLH